MSGRRLASYCLIGSILFTAGSQADSLKSSSDAPSFQAARAHALGGRYDEAIAMYEKLAESSENAVRAACARSIVDRQVGDLAGASKRLNAVSSVGKNSATWHASMAAVQASRGEYEEAVRLNRRAIELDEELLQAHWQLGQVLEAIGKTKEAIRVYEVFEDALTGEQLPDDAEGLTWLGRGFYRYSVLTGNASLVQRTRHVLTEIYQEAFDFVDSQYWPARQAAAELLLAKHNLPEAREDFERVLKQNPKAADAIVGLGRAALEDWDFEEAEKRVDAALAVNPSHAGALVLLARTRMTERRYGDAVEAAQRAAEARKRSVEVLGLLAAARRRAGDRSSAAEELLEAARKIDPKPAAFHQEMGRWLSAARQYEEAEPQFKKAIEYAPWWPDPRTALGQLYMETGDEANARRALEASFKLDSFNRHTHNVLALLDRLDEFARLESDHFIIKYDAKKDAVVAPYMSELLEEIYEEVCDNFETKLDRRTIIEIFPDHMGFSVRIAGRPFIATVGACTGRVIALTAPRGRPPFGRFNWANVLRHEFTHTVTLAATENRIPHWMTEGLAVLEEPAPRSWEWKQMLSERVRRDRLFTLESIDWGFMRPRGPNDRTVAYAQSEWMAEYIIRRYRYQAILDLLAAFRDGRSQEEAFREVLEIDCKDFDEDFKAWAQGQVKGWGLPATIIEDPKEIAAALEAAPEDAALWSRLAQAELLAGRLDEAQAAAARALEANEAEVLALQVMGQILIARMLAEEDKSTRRELIDRAEPYLRRLHELDPENQYGIKYLGYVEQAWAQWNEAVELYEQYQKRFPEDPDTYRRMAGIYLRRRDHDSALGQLETLFRLVEDEPAVARQAASIHADRGHGLRAAHWFRRALEIDPYDVATHAGLADALAGISKFREAEREYKVLVELRPAEADGYIGLSRVYNALGDSKQAEKYRRKAESLGSEGLPRSAEKRPRPER